MRRRRQKNPLLMRIIVISVAVHLVALPVLAHFGAFKKIQQHFVEARMVVLPPPPAPEKEKAEVKKQAQQKPAPTAKKGPANVAHAHQGPKSNPNAPHLALAKGGPHATENRHRKNPTAKQAFCAQNTGPGGAVSTVDLASVPMPRVGNAVDRRRVL